MIKAILQHVTLLYCFRHDGRGLPRHGPLPIILGFIAVTMLALRDLVSHENAAQVMVTAAVGILWLHFLRQRKPEAVAPISLILIAGDFVAMMITPFDAGGYAIIGITMWEIAAAVATVARVFRTP